MVVYFFYNKNWKTALCLKSSLLPVSVVVYLNTAFSVFLYVVLGFVHAIMAVLRLQRLNDLKSLK